MEEEDEVVPDHLRCKRTDGRKWRCKRKAEEGKNMCEIHLMRGIIASSRRKKIKLEVKSDSGHKCVSLLESRMSSPRKRRIKDNVVENCRKRKVKKRAGIVKENGDDLLGGDIEIPDNVVDSVQNQEASKGVLEKEKNDIGILNENGENSREQELVDDVDSMQKLRVKKGASEKEKREIALLTEEEGNFMVMENGEELLDKENIIENVVERSTTKRILQKGKKKIGMVKKRKALKEETEEVPDNLRCWRTDGKQWRCPRRAEDDKKFCELHYLQARHRQYREKVPESLKLQRKPGKTAHKYLKKKLTKLGKKGQLVKVSEALDEALKKMGLEKGDLTLELITLFLKRKVETYKERVLEGSNGEDILRKLPNGLLVISPCNSPHDFDNAAPSCNVKIGLGINSVNHRCFRSKNIEPLPISSLQVVPFTKSLEKLKRVQRNCHWCLQQSCQNLIRCSSCQKEDFCMECVVEKCRTTTEEVEMSCPVCRGTCNCALCLANQPKDVSSQDAPMHERKIHRILQLHYLLCMLLPVLRQINKDQSIELELEAKIRGRELSALDIQPAEYGCDRQICCNNCRICIVDFHRSCPNCCYSLCLSCCRDLSMGMSLKGTGEVAVKELDRSILISCYGQPTKAIENQMKTSEYRIGSTFCASSLSLPYWKVCNGDGSISCPPMEFGGCGNGLLELKRLFPSNWTKELETNAEEIVCSYDFPETFDVSSSCPLCCGIDNKFGGVNQLQQAATRGEYNNDFLYYPGVEEIHDGDLEHFQEHWVRGHPIVVRNVLQRTSTLSWDPVFMFGTYLQSSSGSSIEVEETIDSYNWLNWCEVEIGLQQLYVTSSDGLTRANTLHETLKLKGRLSSHLFQKIFPAHYADAIRAVPVQEYMKPGAALLNIATKLPHKISKLEKGPYVHISQGIDEESTYSLRKLCCDAYDMVNILVHATDNSVSGEQVTRIRKLMKRHKPHDHGASTRTTNDLERINKMTTKASFAGDGLHAREGVSGESCYSATTHEACAINVKNRDRSCCREGDADSEVSILCSENVQSSENSNDQSFSQNFMDMCNWTKPVMESCGAQWDVFRRQDIPKLIDYLKRHSSELKTHPSVVSLNAVHPIIDQTLFLDSTHKARLKDEYKIEPWTFRQHVGEAVIIPAGCAYQVRNHKSCVSVSLDFVSPENVKESINMIDALRLLPNSQKAKEQKLEVKKMSVYSISAAIKEFRELTCTKTSVVQKSALDYNSLVCSDGCKAPNCHKRSI